MNLRILFIALCVLAATLPACRTITFASARSAASSGALTSSQSSTSVRTGFPGWDFAPISNDLQRVQLGARETRFAKDFPGEIGVFTDGTSTFVVRWLDRPTRQLHPASDCLRALGYEVDPCPILQKNDGSLWSVCEARRGPEKLRIQERLTGSDGRAWTDVSTWFWHATLGRAKGPWWAVTEITPE